MDTSPALSQSLHLSVLLPPLFPPLPSLSRLLISDTHFDLHRGEVSEENKMVCTLCGAREQFMLSTDPKV